MKRIYNIILFALFSGAVFAHEGHDNLVEGLHEAQVTGTTTADGNYTFLFYTEDGKLYQGYSEVFIALVDKAGNWVEDFTVSNFAPLMDMPMSGNKHSTPVGKVTKVDGKPLHRTWFSFLMYTGQMNGSWSLDFDYSIGHETGKIAGAAPQVEPYPEGVKGIQSFNSKYYASIANPLSYVGGAQTLQAYINENVVGTEPYQIVEGGYKIVLTPQYGTTVSPAVTLLWNTAKGIYEGAVNFNEEGLWTLYFKVLDAHTDALVAGANGTESTLTWKINVGSGGGVPSSISPVAAGTQVQVYPALTQGDVTVEVPIDATVSVFNLSGQRLLNSVAYAGTPLTLNLSRYSKGFYLISIRTASGETITRKVVN
ncbi:MAG: T9SS type A sorting domain-containing protein [Tannerellaceae bacterium]|jgi:hypothetical protein|nr:T9SS type A sorting domain-containing protein [Tannerellaceae bacterium]